MDENLQGSSGPTLGACRSLLFWACPSGPAPLAVGTGAQGPCQDDQLWEHWVWSLVLGPWGPTLRILFCRSTSSGVASVKNTDKACDHGCCCFPPLYGAQCVLTSRVHTPWTRPGRGEQSWLCGAAAWNLWKLAKELWDQALSLWSESIDSKTLYYQRTNPREYHIVRTHTEETTWI